MSPTSTSGLLSPSCIALGSFEGTGVVTSDCPAINPSSLSVTAGRASLSPPAGSCAAHNASAPSHQDESGCMQHASTYAGSSTRNWAALHMRTEGMPAQDGKAEAGSPAEDPANTLHQIRPSRMPFRYNACVRQQAQRTLDSCPSPAKLSWKAACRAARLFGSRLPNTVWGLMLVEGTLTCSWSPCSIARRGVPTGVGHEDCMSIK